MSIHETGFEDLRVLSTDSTDSRGGQEAGKRSPGAVSEDWGCGSEIAQADVHPEHEMGNLSDMDGVGELGGGNNLLNALRSRGGRPANVSAPFTALQYPLLNLGDHEGLQSRTEATLNLLNNLLGSAIMVMPRAFANVGILGGAVICVAMVMANRYTLLVILKMSLTTLEQEPSYPEIGKRVFGQQGLLAVLLSYVLLCGGCLIGMTIALADCLQQILTWDAPRPVWVLLAVIINTPGAFVKTLKHIAILSGVCMLGVVTIVVMLATICLSDVFIPSHASLVGTTFQQGVTTSAAPSTEALRSDSVRFMIWDPHGIFVTVSLFAFQFSIQAGGIEVLTRIAPEEETNESNSDGYESSGIPVADRITKTAFSLAALMSGTLGVAGYLRFGTEAKGNILLNFTRDEHFVPMTMIRIAYVFVITCSFAFIIVPLRFAAYDLFNLRRRNAAGDIENVSTKTFRKTTVVILFACLFTGTCVSDLAVMFNYVGVWATMGIGFVLPCAFQIELRRRQEGTDYFSTENAVPAFLIVLGIGIVLGNTCGWIWSFMEPSAPTTLTTPSPVSAMPLTATLSPSTMAPVSNISK